MFTLKFKWLALIASAFLAVVAAQAQDSGPLIDLLVKKGLINDQEGEELRAELARDASAAVTSTISGGKSTASLSIAGRIQVQYAGLSTDISGTAADPVATNHFFLRRIYLGAKANLGAGWTSSINYDFAGSTFDEAKITWTRDDALAVDIGFRKVPFGLEEWYTSSGSLKAIERSPATRYFVEPAGRRQLPHRRLRRRQGGQRPLLQCRGDQPGTRRVRRGRRQRGHQREQQPGVLGQRGL